MSKIETDQTPRKKSGIPRLVDATRVSTSGFAAAFRYEEAFRLEIFAFCVLAPLGIWVGESRIEQVLLVTSLVLVLLAELINSAIEAVVDRGGTEFDVLAGRAKDLGSAAVLLCLLLAIFVWAMVLI